MDPDYGIKVKKIQDDYTLLVEYFGMYIILNAHELFFPIAPWLEKVKIPLGLCQHMLKNIYMEMLKIILKRNVWDAPNFDQSFLNLFQKEKNL